MKNQKTVIVSNESEIQKTTNEINNAKDRINTVLTAYYQLDLPVKPKTMQDVLKLIENCESFIKKELETSIPETPTILGMRIGKAKAVELIELPDLKELVTAANECNTIERYELERLAGYLHLKGKKAEIDPEKLQQLKDINTISAIDTVELEAFEAHKELVKCVNKMKALNLPLYGGTKLDSLCLFTDNENHAEIKLNFWSKNFDKLRAHRHD